MTWVAVLACVVGAGFAGVRWLRVAQREHYLPGSVSRFASRWWIGLGFNALLAMVVAVNVALTFAAPFFGVVVAAAVAAGPFGLPLRGRAPGKLAWTRRLRTLAAVTALLFIAVVAVGAFLDVPAGTAALATAAVPLIVDGALALTAPVERRFGRRWVDRAERRLREVDPTVVAITGSYGKTTTKGYVAYLLEGTRRVLATPKSFNNSAGLARTVNEHLTPGTEVFVAEMGTYGPGEIAEMCEWARPRISAITAIGPVHLERMRSEEKIAEAKSEIFSTAEVAVLNVDNELLAPIADRLEREGKRVVRCSAVDGDVVARDDGDEIVVTAGDQEVGRVDKGSAAPTNVAVAVALALEAGATAENIGKRLSSLPVAPNRLTVGTGASGATVIDDTYNSNPAGVRAALSLLREVAERDGGRAVVVTPGMIELGHRQADENEKFAATAADVASDVLIVGNTNRKALRTGAAKGDANVHVFDTRDEAVAWVKENVGEGDVVLYENDLPDHYP